MGMAQLVKRSALTPEVSSSIAAVGSLSTIDCFQS